MDSWDRRTRNLTDYLAKTVLKRHLRRAFKITLPLAAAKEDLPKDLRRELVEEMVLCEHGEWSTNHFGETAKVKWAPFPHVEIDETSGEIKDSTALKKTRVELDLEPGEISGTFGCVQTPAVGTWFSLVPNAQLDGLLLKSIRNSLDRKRTQFPHDDAPYLLVVTLGHHRLIVNAVNQLIAERIWPNQDYGWMTGLCFFRPRVGFLKGSPSSSMLLSLNPNSRIEPSESLIQLFNGERQFHQC